MGLAAWGNGRFKFEYRGPLKFGIDEAFFQQISNFPRERLSLKQFTSDSDLFFREFSATLPRSASITSSRLNFSSFTLIHRVFHSQIIVITSIPALHSCQEAHKGK
jgi:hypothetical protein